METHGAVGIFWYCPSSLGVFLVMADAGSDQIQHNDDWIDFKLGHAEVWSRVEADVDWSLYPNYDEEYFYLPRGRILWNVKRKSHRNLVDRDIDLDVLFEALAGHGIDRTYSELLTDSHYRSTLLRRDEIWADIQ